MNWQLTNNQSLNDQSAYPPIATFRRDTFQQPAVLAENCRPHRSLLAKSDYSRVLSIVDPRSLAIFAECGGIGLPGLQRGQSGDHGGVEGLLGTCLIVLFNIFR